MHFGDIVVNDKLLAKLSSEPDPKGVDLSVGRWDNDKRGNLYMIPYTWDRLPYSTAQAAVREGMKMIEEGIELSRIANLGLTRTNKILY